MRGRGGSVPWAVVAAVAAALALPVACEGGGDEAGPPDGLSLSEGGSTVIVEDDWKSCTSVDDCVKVATSCDGCCGEEAVNEALQEDYVDAFQEMCADYEGGVCDCAPLPTVMMCNAGVCELVPDEETD